MTSSIASPSPYNWLTAYRAGGYGQLNANQRFGRPMKLSPAQIAWVHRTVAGATPLTASPSSSCWTDIPYTVHEPPNSSPPPPAAGSACSICLVTRRN